MKQIEILAPAGSMESLLAGVRCGANAVYLGGTAFSARQNAGNFDAQTLREAVTYCHVRGVKVYLTVNTLLGDRELERALLFVQEALNAGVDALIVQDIGLAALVKQCFPDAAMHASTQMSVMTPGGFTCLKEMGFCRAVLPREMSQEEIAEVERTVPIALEAFVHGALCMCVSGQCYMSAMLGSRSGNRGLCAQPCRLPFFVKEQERCGLSLKDLSLISKMNEMTLAGVTSFKIEGRMKRPEYVAAAVTACREAKEGCLTPERLSALQAVFSRSGFTKGYFTGQRGAAMFGTRQKEDVISAKSVLSGLATLYQKETPLVPITFSVQVCGDKPVRLTACAAGAKVTVFSQTMPQVALSKPMTTDSLTARLSKCGGTPYYVQAVEAELEDGLILPAAELNGLRRDALGALSAQLAPKREQRYNYTNFPLLNRKEQTKRTPFYWRGVFYDYEAVPKNAALLDEVFLPLETSEEQFVQAMKRFKAVGVLLPRGLFGKEKQMAETLKALKKIGISSALTGNLGGLRTAMDLGLVVHGDFGLNVFNSAALEQFASMGVVTQTLSMELTAEQMAAMNGPIPTGAILYGRLPLMLTRNCPVKNEINCTQCDRNAGLTDRKGIVFPVRCTYGCSEIYNSRPVYLADRKRELSLSFGTLLFTTETKAEAEAVIDGCLAGEAPTGVFTRGLAYRGVE